MRFYRIGLCAAALFLISVPALAHGAPPAPTPKKHQAAHGHSKTEDAMHLFKAEQWEAAYQKFREADERSHAPTNLLYMARCQWKLGKLLESRAIYERLLAEKPPRKPSEAVVEMRESAEKELEIVRIRTPRVKIVLTGIPASARVSVDGAQVTTLGSEIELNPGSHTIEVTAADMRPMARSFTLSEGRTKVINLVRRTRGEAGARAS